MAAFTNAIGTEALKQVGGNFNVWKTIARNTANAIGGPIAIDCLNRMEAIVDHAVGVHVIKQTQQYPFDLHVNAPGASVHTVDPSLGVDIQKTSDFAAIDDTIVDELANSFNLIRQYGDKDAPHFQLLIGPPCPTQCKIPNTLEAISMSPVSIIVTDPLGRRIGFDSSTGTGINEIGPDAHYNGFGEPQIITISGLDPGNYNLNATASGNGPFTLELIRLNEEGEYISVQTQSGTAALGLGIQPMTMTIAENVSINIKPGEFPKSINPRNRGRIPVAIISTGQFDARTVDSQSLSFGRTGDEKTGVFCHEEDVNLDGLADLVCHFNTKGTGFQKADTIGVLKGKTFDGTPIVGSDSVNIVP